MNPPLGRRASLDHRIFRVEAALGISELAGVDAIADPQATGANWHAFTLSRYDAKSGEWQMEKALVYHIVD